MAYARSFAFQTMTLLRRMLAHPCDLVRRIQSSVLTYSKKLLPAGTTLNASRKSQKTFSGFDLD